MNSDTIDKIKKDIIHLTDEIKRERDELNVQAHLAKAEILDEWEKAEKNWDHFKAKVKLLSKETKKSSHEINTALELLGSEIKKSYKKIKRLI